METEEEEEVEEKQEGKRGSCPVRFKRRINSILMFRAIPQTEARVGDSF